jgi:hypothetical protein
LFVTLNTRRREEGIANLATIMPNGSLQVTPAWFDFDSKCIRIVGTRIVGTHLTRRFLAG